MTTRNQEDGWAEVHRAVTVDKSPEELYAAWRDIAAFPLMLSHVKSVEVESPTRSHWEVEGPAGTTVRWESEIVRDVPGREIAWRSLQDSEVDNEGAVTFLPAPGGEGTEVHVELRYRPPAGALGRVIAMFFHRDPDSELADDLRRFKQIQETGAVPTIIGQSSGREKEAAEATEVPSGEAARTAGEAMS